MKRLLMLFLCLVMSLSFISCSPTDSTVPPGDGGSGLTDNSQIPKEFIE